MRLVDFDKLIELYSEYFGKYTINELKEIREENMPFTKAIPIDWITKYLHELNKQAEEEMDFIINELGGYETCHKMGYVIGIEKMLEKWEKENE